MTTMTPFPHVLVVEDEALILFALTDELRDAGFIVFEARNADQAIEMLEAHAEIAILFTDIDMPGSMDGIKLSHAVRNRWPPVKIIVTSGKHRPDVHILPDGGMFLPKPYAASAVAAAIHALHMPGGATA